MKIRTKNKTYKITINRNAEIGEFEVLPMDVNETNKLLKKHTKHEKIKGQVMPETDYLSFAIDKTIKTIISWNLTDENDNPLVCNDENKKTAYILNPDIINDVLEHADKIASGQAEVEIEQEKNF